VSYIESHEELESHPKTLDLMAALGLDADAAVGKLHRFWWWCMKYAETGVLDKHPEPRIDAKFGRGFVAAMRAAGFIDKERYRIHDWPDYAGRYLSTRFRTRKPLYLASIYLEYGRVEEAQKVLEAAVKADRLTKEQANAAMGLPPASAPAAPPAPEGTPKAKSGENHVCSEQTPEKTAVESEQPPQKSPLVASNSTQLILSQPIGAQRNSAHTPQPPPGVQSAGEPPPKRSRGQPSPEALTGFAEFVALYPNQSNLKAAVRAWASLAPSPELRVQLAEHVRKRRLAPPWSGHIAKGTVHFIPTVASFLRGERWKDPILAAPPVEAPQSYEGPPTTDPYEPKTPVQCLVCVYKMLKDVAMEDRAWDAAQWSGVEPSARLLLGAFDGDDRAASVWLEDYAQELKLGGITNWTMNSAARRAWDTRSERTPKAAGKAS
jgi:hypothetical protein